MSIDNNREEILRLREENLRLREQNLRNQSSTSSSKAHAHVVNVKQVNESFLSGCAGVIGMMFLIIMVVSQCSG
jgi:hypothetical protein